MDCDSHDSSGDLGSITNPFSDSRLKQVDLQKVLYAKDYVTENYKDMVGNDVSVGDIIAYPTIVEYHLEMIFAKITKINDGKVRGKIKKDPNGFEERTLPNPEGHVKIMIDKKLCRDKIKDLLNA